MQTVIQSVNSPLIRPPETWHMESLIHHRHDGLARASTKLPPTNACLLSRPLRRYHRPYLSHSLLSNSRKHPHTQFTPHSQQKTTHRAPKINTMGASASKGAKAAAGSAARKYPSRPPTSTTTAASAAPVQNAAAGPRVHPAPQATSEKTEGTVISPLIYRSNYWSLPPWKAT